MMALHTSDGCSIVKTDHFSGSVNSKNCYVNAPGQEANQGCSITADGTGTYGNGFNAVGGGVYATEWFTNDIKIWHFARNAIPEDIKVRFFGF